MSIASVVLEGFGGSIPSVVFGGFGTSSGGSGLPIIAPINRVFLFESRVTKTLVIGDTFREIGTAFAGESQDIYDLSDAAEIKACLVSHDHSRQLTEPVTLSPSARGADWESGRVAIVIPKTLTSRVLVKAETLAKVEIQVSYSSGEEYTWFADVLLRQGHIV